MFKDLNQHRPVVLVEMYQKRDTAKNGWSLKPSTSKTRQKVCCLCAINQSYTMIVSAVMPNSLPMHWAMAPVQSSKANKLLNPSGTIKWETPNPRLSLSRRRKSRAKSTPSNPAYLESTWQSGKMTRNQDEMLALWQNS